MSSILDISKLQAGKMILQPKEFWLRDTVNTALNGWAAAAEEKNLKLTWQVESVLPEVLLGDSHCLRQVLGNVVGNAIKFTAAGEVAVHVTGAAGDPCLLHFSVRDTGIGIPPAKQQVIFEPFSQVDGSRRREFGGTGLGLAISAQLVEMMAGEMWVESDGLRGSTFHFTVRMSAVSPVTTERRRELRFAADDAAWIELPGAGTARRHEVRVVDISTGGMKLRSALPLEPGTPVRVRWQEGAVPAVVRYCVAEGSGFFTGLEFPDAD